MARGIQIWVKRMCIELSRLKVMRGADFCRGKVLDVRMIRPEYSEPVELADSLRAQAVISTRRR